MARAENSHKQEQTYVYIPSSPNMEHYFRIGSCFFFSPIHINPANAVLVNGLVRWSARQSTLPALHLISKATVCDFGNSLSSAWRERG